MEKIPIYHRKCKKIAFYSLKRWTVGEAMKCNDAISIDGKPLKAGDIISCGSCGEPTNDLTYTEPE